MKDGGLTPEVKQRLAELYEEREEQRQAESRVNFARAVRLSDALRRMQR